MPWTVIDRLVASFPLPESSTVPPATARVFLFTGIRAGQYTVTAAYGRRRAVKKVKVAGDTSDCQMSFE